MYLYNVYKVMNFLTLSAALVFIKLIFFKNYTIINCSSFVNFLEFLNFQME